MKKELKVGLFFVFPIAFFYLGSLYLGNIEFFSKNFSYNILFERNIGLQESSLILYKGIPIGKVESLKILYESDCKLLVKVSVDKRVKITKNTEVKMTHTNMIELGGVVLELNLQDGDQIDPGDTLVGSIKFGVGDSIAPTIKSLEDLLLVTNKFLFELAKNTDKIASIFDNIDEVTKLIKIIIVRNEKNFFNISKDISEITSFLNNRSKGFKVILEETHDFFKALNSINLIGISSSFERVMKVLEFLTEKTVKGENSLGKFLFDSEFYNSLNKTILDSDRLVVDLKNHPSRYVNFSIFGSFRK